MKIEKLDGTSKVTVKNNKTYTYNIKTKVWLESPIKEGVALPGTGIYPKVTLVCKEEDLALNIFNTW